MGCLLRSVVTIGMILAGFAVIGLALAFFVALGPVGWLSIGIALFLFFRSARA